MTLEHPRTAVPRDQPFKTGISAIITGIIDKCEETYLYILIIISGAESHMREKPNEYTRQSFYSGEVTVGWLVDQ